MDIAIKPGAAPRVPVDTHGNGTIPVAILSTPTFDATTSVDQSTLRFGRTGSEDSLAFCNPGGEDVNGDGLPDLVCHFRKQLTGFQSGDTLAILQGATVDGSPIVGQEPIVVH